MAEQQNDVSPATAGGVSAPWTIRKHGGRTVSLHEGDEPRALVFEPDHAARILAALNPPSLPPFKLRPVLGEPAVNMDGDEDGNEWPDSVSWSLSLGCQLTFGHGGDETGDATAQVSMSDMDLRRGTTKRTATRAQVAAFGRLLVEQFGEPDPRDAEITRLRAELAGAARAADDINQLARDALRQQRDEAREEWKRADAEVTRLKRLVGDENVPYDGWDGLSRQDAIVRCEEGWQEYLKVRDERDGLRAELDRAEALIDTDGRCRVAESDGWRCRLFAGHDGQHLPQTPPGWSREWTTTPTGPRRWVAGDPEPEVGTTATWGTRQLNWSRRAHGDWEADEYEEFPSRLSWAQLLAEAGELVEVVSTDG